MIVWYYNVFFFLNYLTAVFTNPENNEATSILQGA
jgi:hypothetical protein